MVLLLVWRKNVNVKKSSSRLFGPKHDMTPETVAENSLVLRLVRRKGYTTKEDDAWYLLGTCGGNHGKGKITLEKRETQSEDMSVLRGKSPPHTDWLSRVTALALPLNGRTPKEEKDKKE